MFQMNRNVNILFHLCFSCLCVREEIAVATDDGNITRLRWNGTVNNKGSMSLWDVTVAADFLQSRSKRNFLLAI